MKHISVLVPQGDSILSSIIGPYKVFKQINDHLKSIGSTPAFDIHLVGLTGETQLYEGLFSVHPDTMLKDVKKTDVIIIPAMRPWALKENLALVPWITEQYKQGAEVASLCTGAFLLAATGMMKGRQCTTHWAAADAFRQMFPDVILATDKIITDEDGIYSSGGAYSFLNLVLYLVEKYCGRDMAIFCSKMFEVDINRGSQSPFTMFLGQKEHEDEPIKKAQLFIENSIGDKISVDQLADMFSLSRRNFERRFKKATANTPVEYLQRVKIEAAKKSLESGRNNINEVMYSVGYSDNKAFRTTFKKITGLSPLEYRKKYNREASLQYSTRFKSVL